MFAEEKGSLLKGERRSISGIPASCVRKIPRTAFIFLDNLPVKKSIVPQPNMGIKERNRGIKIEFPAIMRLFYYDTVEYHSGRNIIFS